MKELNPLSQIELSHVVKMVREAAELRPNRRAACRYLKLHKDEPMCIVGAALVSLGVPTEWLRHYNMDGISELVPPNWVGELDLIWLEDVQEFQDSKNSWRKAVKMADEAIESRWG